MKIKRNLAVLLLFLSGFSVLRAQYDGTDYSLSLNYNYATSSKLYPQPKSSDEILKGMHSYLDRVHGFGIELRRRITENFFIGLGAEYMEKKGKITTVSVIVDYITNITAEDGYKVIPVELTGYYFLPFSLTNFKFFMGWGAGYYFGTHIRNIGDISAVTESRETAFGIHIVCGLDAMLTDYLSVRGSIKFRDVEFSTHNKYNKTEGTYENVQIRIMNETFDSKIAIDGIAFSIGLAFHF